jgi:hypothetical protein
MNRLLLLLTARPGADRDQVHRAVSDAAIALKGAEVETRVGVRLVDDPLPAMAKATARSLTSIDGVIELTAAGDGDIDVLIGHADGLGDELGVVFDLTDSSALAGVVHTITSGGGDVLLALGTYRLPTITPEQMHHHWLHVHAPLALSMMPEGAEATFGYQQFHADVEASELAAKRVGLAGPYLDGVLQVASPEPSTFLSVAAEPEFARRIYEDEQNFALQEGMRGAFLGTWTP